MNFLLKSDTAVLIRTGTASVAIHGNVRLSRTSCSLHPVFLHFSRKYHHLPTNILGRTFRPPWAFCILESFKKTVAPAGYKNKQCRKQTSVLSGRIMTAYVPLRSATERERAAFLIPCQGLRGFDSISLLTLNFAIFTIKAENMSMVYKYYEKS